METQYEPTEREKLIHQWKSLTSRGMLDEANLLKKQLEKMSKIKIPDVTEDIPEEISDEKRHVAVVAEPIIAQSVVESKPEVVTTEEVKRGRGRPRIDRVINLPIGVEFTVKSVVGESQGRINQPTANTYINEMLARGEIKLSRTVSEGRGRPRRIFIKNS